MPSTEFAPHPRANRQVQLRCDGGSFHIGYEWIAAQRRSVGMRITAEGLQVRAPRRVSQRELHDILQSRAHWIVTRLTEQQQHQKTQQQQPDWGDGACVAWQGQWLCVALGLAGRSAVLQTVPPALLAEAPEANATSEPTPSPRVRRIGAAAVADAARHAGAMQETDQENNHETDQESDPKTDQPPAPHTPILHLPLPHNAPPARIATAVQTWLRKQALARLQQGVAHYAPPMGVRPTQLALTNARARWGSASAQGHIRLHWRLIQLDPALFDYVLVHELAHLHEMNHSPRFWAHVQAAMPDYAQRRERLRQIRLEEWGA